MTNIATSRSSYTAEFKAKIVLAGLAGKCTVKELCRRNHISENLYYNWRKRFILAGTFGLEKKVRVRFKRPISSDDTARGNEDIVTLGARFYKCRKELSPFPIRMSASEKMAAIDLVGSSKISNRTALKCINVPSSSYYRWVQKLRETGTLESCVRKPEYRSITLNGKTRKSGSFRCCIHLHLNSVSIERHGS